MRLLKYDDDVWQKQLYDVVFEPSPHPSAMFRTIVET